MKDHFTTREVAKILDLPQWRIRYSVRAGFLSPSRGPGRQYQLTFQDLLLLKTTKGLLDSRVPLRRVRRILNSLKRQLPQGQQVWNLTIYADGRRVVVWDGRARWQPDSGQFLFNFEAEKVAEKVELPVAAQSAPSTLTAEQWFDLASELERNSPEEARRAYHQALLLDPTLVAAHINLGRLYHEACEFEPAEAHYREAITQAPRGALAHFNLGVLLEDRGRAEEAIGAYRRAVECDSTLADAHYNLALLLEARGRRSEALKHFGSARKLYGRGEG
jgi:tetratricopeptide (TPR) repeat protein